MDFKDITFVIQGPVIESITKKSIDNVRKLFPSSFIILSTWKGENISNINADLVIENEDPGPTILSYGKDDIARKANINRQICSTLNGLNAVQTEYAVKLRSDNILHSNEFIHYLNKFTKKTSQFSLFDQKIIYSNLFAKEITKGTKIPYFFSDFFHFGKTTDLKKLWSIDLFSNYNFQDRLSGKFQHKQYPMRCSHVEQDLWLAFLSKNTGKPFSLNDEYGANQDIADSYNYMINNIIILDYGMIGLEVPSRLEQPNKFPYEFYSFLRWKWLYESYFNLKSSIPINYKLKWYIGYFYKFIHHGIRYKAKGLFLKIKNYLLNFYNQE
ncbi:WavE lipopolysaccharide synthesis family protein [Vibrio salinus]|uniref:WavE lipopolysaccharide synthesis family protein n=1 Tax=Vibrio salinus TaxID=2899784 RepID=UPI001E4412F7|nr:WavE lipopolysaccharide synthesis family protein [Vibrio salinus]MCE0493755.1 WavE lipopolysaccharide synthesis family protein [Vibrio salinus]